MRMELGILTRLLKGGTSSNHVEFKLFDHGSETVPTVTLESHTSNYSVHVAHERLSLEEGTGTDNLRGYFGSDSYLSWLESTNALTVPGTIAATNFSGSSSGTNTGDQTLPTLSSLGGASSGYLTNTGGAKLEIQNGQDGGSSYGIYMWTSSNTDWGIYMAQAGDNKALNDGTASAGIDGATSHAIRFRVNDSSGQAGFIWENNSNETLMQLNGGSEKLYTRNAIYPSNQTTNYVDSTRIANWQTAYGWGDHGLSTQDKTDITNLSGTNTGDQTFATLGAATRTNYTLTFKPPASSYAGFQFLNTSGNGAGYFLIRGTSDTDVYTAEGITLVADAGWLTLAQRTTSDKGIKFMTGATAATRMTIANDGDININNSLTVGSDLGVNGFIKDSLYKHAGNTNWRTKKYVRSVGITGGDIGDSWVQLSRVVISSTYEKVTIKFTINGYDDVSSGVEAIDVKYENGSTAQENHQCAWYSTDDNANLFKNVRSIRSASNGLSNTYDLYVQMAGDWRDNFTVVAEEWTTHGDNASIAYTTANGSATEPSAGSNDIERTERRWYTENSYMYLGSGRVYTTSDFTNNSSNWDTAYTDRNKWDGGSTGLTASTGRASLGLGTAATAAATAFATSGHNHAGVYALEYELMQSDNSDRDMHVWRKNHAMLSDDSGISTYIIVQTNVPQDNYSMGGFTLVYQDHYSSSSEGGEIKIYGYWNPESNSGFIGFRYECSNPYHTPTIEVCRNSSSGDTAFFISGEGGSYTQLIAKDLWLGYSASSATSQWGDSWTITQADAKDGYTNFDTLNRNDFSAITTNGSTPSLTGGVSAAEVRTLIGAGTGNGSSDLVIGTTATTAMAGNTAIPSATDILDLLSTNNILNWTVDQGTTNIHSGNYNNTQLSNAEVISAIVASSSIDNTDKGTIRSNIGAGTSSLTIGTTSTTAMAGNTSLFDGAYSSLSGTPTIPSGNAIIDWTADQGNTNIHSGNYSNTQLSQEEVLGMLTAGANITITTDGEISATDTDTVYTHPTTAGNKHIPSGGSAGEFLRYSSSGTAVWATPSYTTNTNTTYSAGTGLDLTGTTFSIEPDLRDGVTRIGKDTSNYIAIGADTNVIDFHVGGVWVARMESDGDLHMKGDVIAFSDIFNP